MATKDVLAANQTSEGPEDVAREANGEKKRGSDKKELFEGVDVRVHRDLVYLLRRRRLDEAVQTLWKGLRTGAVSNRSLQKGLGMVVDALARAKRLTEAEALARDFIAEAGMTMSMPIMNSIIHGYGGAGQPLKALQHFENLQEAHGLAPDVYCYATITLALARAGRIDKARELYQQMISSGMEPCLVVLNGIMDGCAKVGNAEAAHDLLQEYKVAGVSPDRGTYTSLITANINGDRMDNAERILAMLEERLPADEGMPDVVTYGVFVTALTRRRDMTKALTFLERLRNRGLKPNSFIYCSLLSGAGQARRLATLHHVIDEMEKDDLDVQLTDAVTQVLIRALFKCNAMDEAQQLHDDLCQNWKLHLEATGADAVGTALDGNTELSAHDERRSYNGATRPARLQQRKSRDPSRTPPRPTAMTFVVLAECYARSGNLQAAEETLRQAALTAGCAPPVSAKKVILRALPRQRRKLYLNKEKTSSPADLRRSDAQSAAEGGRSPMKRRRAQDMQKVKTLRAAAEALVQRVATARQPLPPQQAKLAGELVRVMVANGDVIGALHLVNRFPGAVPGNGMAPTPPVGQATDQSSGMMPRNAQLGDVEVPVACHELLRREVPF